MAIETTFCSQTNWTVLSGSLLNCVTFQTPLSFSEDDEESSHNPLLLHSPALYPSPCEITINFTEKFEVRQVYVRSTAKVFEVYCAPDSKSGNEYLCTVRCGVATRDGEVLRPLGYKDSGEESAKSEDDWVEVKNVDDPSIENTDQDFFEATAVIDNMNPCISVSVRLLSLQRRGYVCVDEVYVFGDPVEIEPETQESHNENTSRNALMAMCLPALMQMSMTKGLSHLGDNLKETPHLGGSILENQLKGKASIMDQEKLKEIEGEESEISNGSNKMQSDRASVPPQVTQMNSNCSAIPSKIPEMENNHCAVPSQVAINQGDFSGGNVERAVEKLKSQMDRIEEICLSFQEKMVLPMNSIETRLQRVEQQLEALSKKSQNPALPSGYRISAPDVSFVESDANSCENGVDYTDTREVESDKKYSHAEEVNAAVNDMSDSGNTTQLIPGLIVTAPEFPEGEDEEDNASEQTMTSNHKEKQSHAEEVNADVNDMSDSENTTQLIPGLIVTAPEFPEGEDEEDNASEQTMTSNHKEKQSIGENEEDNASGETITSNQKVKQSIDDALSSAFANFVSSVSLESAKSKGISVKAPEFTDEDDDDHESNNTLNSYGVESSIGTLSTDEDDDDESSIGTLSTDSDEDDDDNERNNGTRNTEVIVLTDSDQDEVCVNASILPEHNLKTDVKEKENLKKSGKCQNSEASTSISRLISNEMIAKHFPVGGSISCSTYAGLEPEHIKDTVKEKENLKKSEKCQNSEASTSISRLISNGMIAKHFPIGCSISCSTYAGLEPEHIKDNVKEKENQKVSEKCQNSEASTSNSRFISNGMVVNNYPGRCEKCQNSEASGGCGFPWDDGLSARTKHTAATKPALKTFRDKSLGEALGFPDPPPEIDFKFPVSEMEFMSYIDACLGKKPDTGPRASSVMESNEDFSVNEQPQVNADLSVEKHSNLILVREQVHGNDDLSVEDHSNLISVYDVEPRFPASSNNFDLLEMLGYIEPEPVNIEGGDLAEDYKGMHDESSTPSSPIGGHDLEEFNDTSMHDLLSTLSPI